MAGILLVIDGMTDAGFTLKQMPQLYRLSREYAHGLLRTTPRGAQPETTACVLNLLGLGGARAGRGWLEALGAGVPFLQRDLLCKASWVSVDDAGKITGLCGPPPGFAYPGYRHLHGWQALLVLPGEAERLEGLRTVPPHQSIGAQLAEVWPSGSTMLDAVCRYAKRGGKALLPWGQAVPGSLPGMDGVVITATGGVRGIAHACGMDCPDVPGATGDVNTNLWGKARAALEAADWHGFVLLHLNGADEAAHRREPEAKHAYLQRVDALLPQLAGSGHRLLVCADHGACPQTGAHLGGPQPFVLVDGGKTGDLGTLQGKTALRLLQYE